MSERIVVVTGAGSGIGHATAALFHDLGDTVYGLDVSGAAPEGVDLIACDVSSKETVERVIGEIGERHGRIDVLANVAGIVQFGRFETVSEQQLDAVFAVNAKGPFLLIQAALPYLKACRGNVVNVSSVAGNVGQPYSAAYSASKGALTMLTRSLAVELAPDRVRVNAVCPGTVDTPLVAAVAENYPTDLDPTIQQLLFGLMPGKPSSPAEVGSAIVYLASPEARTVTGAVLAIDGGMAA
ncbi:MAG TPA: SDR family oxidoreductase [Nocardioides sp.]|nr:SDR family oxidoreductase [Nocardioides sp.]